MTDNFEKLGPVGQKIFTKIKAALAPEFLELIDDSNRHLGHAGHNPSGESHFILKISAAKFAGQSRVQQHRMVHDILAEELKTRVHALNIQIVADPLP